MATGPEHYREAEERLRASDWQRQEARDNDLTGAMHEAAVAQVHATLALAAATALPEIDKIVDINEDRVEWSEATAVTS